MYFYCRGACGKFPVKFQGGNISIKDSQLKQENPNSKGEIQGLQWSNIPTDNLTLETSNEIPRLVFHATMATYLALKGTMVTEQIWPLLVPGHCFFGLKTSGLQYRSWKHFVHFDVRERFINVEDAYFNKRSWNGAQVGELKGEIDKSPALPSTPPSSFNLFQCNVGVQHTLDMKIMIFLTIVALAVDDSDLLLTISTSTEFRSVNFAKKVLIVHVTNWRSKFICNV